MTRLAACNVVTTKDYKSDTGRLQGITAYLPGTASFLQHTVYYYDSLSNLKTRSDAITGVSESFSYDSLNRLSLYTELGGSVSPPLSVETKYDARGNLTYKSDVGQYWYDAARPDRLTNVTLSAPSGATTPLTGTRKLAFAFDDYLPTAKTPTGGVALGNVTLGNGNLMYTVSQDTANSKHTVRYESYTSFNMPLEIQYANLTNSAAGVANGATTAATPSYSCPAGSTLNGTNCMTGIMVTNAAKVTYTCANTAQTLSGTNCIGSVTTTSTTTNICTAGTLTTATTNQTGTKLGCLVTTVAQSYSQLLNTEMQCIMDYSAGTAFGEVPYANNGIINCLYKPKAVETCPQSYNLTSANVCTKAISDPAIASYSCPAGTGTLTGTGATSTCQLARGTTTLASITYSCPAGSSVSGSQCQAVSNNAKAGANGTTVDRTLSFTYGPEHQRIKQVTALSGNGTSSYSSGTVWYLNGEDGQSLTYEKEIKTSGVTEHKHYLQAAGMTFALATQRTGTGVQANAAVGTAASPVYAPCPANQTLVGANCVQTLSVPSTIASYAACPSGQTPSGANCLATSTVTAASNVTSYSCPAGHSLNGSTCTLTVNTVATPAYSCSLGVLASGTYTMTLSGAQIGPVQGCKIMMGSTQNGAQIPIGNCQDAMANGSAFGFFEGKPICHLKPTTTYSCPAGQTLAGSTCSKAATSAAAPIYACPAGQTQVGIGQASTCQRVQTVTTAATPIYSCTAAGVGYSQVGTGAASTCQKQQSLAASIASYSCPAGKFVQGTNPATMCQSASRDSTAAQVVRYFQQDHLGSVAVITDEAGQAVERLAYDPWGKRRNSNGLPDKLDALVGQTTDRGYTEHEHLDEVGVIHMNGRVYDPLVGRFMSADPFVQNPYDLRSFNRYSYVYNNPLKAFDPSGYNMQCSFHDDFGWDCYDDGVIAGGGSSGGGDTTSGGSSGGGTGGSGGSSSTRTLWWQLGIGTAQTIGGGITTMAGGGLCTTVAWCLLGAPTAIIGASETTEGWTKTKDAWNGIKSEGWNPVKSELIKRSTEYGEMIYDGAALGANLVALISPKTLIVGASDGIDRARSMFGVVTTKFDNGFALVSDSVKEFLDLSRVVVVPTKINQYILEISAWSKAWTFGSDFWKKDKP